MLLRWLEGSPTLDALAPLLTASSFCSVVAVPRLIALPDAEFRQLLPPEEVVPEDLPEEDLLDVLEEPVTALFLAELLRALPADVEEEPVDLEELEELLEEEPPEKRLLIHPKSPMSQAS